MMFPDRAPSDLYLYTTFVGGSRNKELAKASTYKLIHFCIQISLSPLKHFLHFVQLIICPLFNFSFRDDLKQIVTSDLRQLLGAEGEPTFVKYVDQFFLVYKVRECVKVKTCYS